MFHSSNTAMAQARSPQAGSNRTSAASGRSTRSGLARQHSYETGLRLTEDQVNAVMETFAEEDQLKSKTLTRIVVENFLSKYAWYFPGKDKPHGPSLSKAYAYYEHITLPRHFTGAGTSDHVFRRAERGEKDEETELYHPFFTPASSFIEWGIGVDLYFATLLYMALILFIAGLINIPNIHFYASREYSPDGQNGLRWSLKGSAICTTKHWVVCDNCVASEFVSVEEKELFAKSADGTLLFVQRNGCKGGYFEQGVVNWVTFIFLLLVGIVGYRYLAVREVRFDEDNITATDYSIVVKNPPPDAYDPDEWRDFFSQFAEKQVTCVTVTLNNEELLQKLVERRIHRKNLSLLLPKNIDLDDEDIVRSAVAKLILEQESDPPGCLMRFVDCFIFPWFRLFGKFLKPQVLVDHVFRLTDEIKELQKKEYQVSKVFVTFETEEGQRNALAGLAVSKIDFIKGNKHALAPSAIFHDAMLLIEEPTEPSAVRWLDLSTSKFKKLAMRVVNLMATVLLISFCGFCVARTRAQLGPRWSGPLISVFNSIIPPIIHVLMIFESHATEGSFQSSLYLKITLFRWVNTVILLKFITPFTNTISDNPKDLLPSINAVLWSELWVVPALRLLDLGGNFNKHILGPRAKNQDLMNLNFQGTAYNLGERYTDLTKVLLLCFFYSALLPSSFFFCAAILIVQYYTDKYCLMRIWAWTPLIGSEVARFSRRYFFTGALLAMALVSAYTWAQFPYDNICVPEGARTGMAGFYPNARLGTGEIKNITVPSSEDKAVVRCKQSSKGSRDASFPPIDTVQQENYKWMNDSQVTLSRVYGYTALVVLVLFVLYYFGDAIIRFLVSWFRVVNPRKGQNQKIDFSTNPEITAFVPQIRAGFFEFPFLTCDIDQMNWDLIGWKDPAKSYDYYNLIFDVPWPGMPRQKRIEQDGRDLASASEDTDRVPKSEGLDPGTELPTPIFAQIKHYPPPWMLRLMNEKNDSP